ncbi:MAG TPA: PVC-type heme-binding CxxCH protein [Tepidisphaeraceae bacterium]|nr:PVC-type heme-binding CxxCH protein [Tepidisphaeraceae bacterium]
MIKSLLLLASLLLAVPLRAQPLSPSDSISAMHLPPGFSATLFAAEPDLSQPISFAIDDRGRLWVAEAYNYPKWKPQGADRILIFEDTDNDGHFDKRTIFYDKLNYVTGLEVGFGGVFVLSPPHLLFIPDKNADDKPDSAPQILLDGFGHQSPHNIVNGGIWGPDGWLYGGHGGTSNGEIKIAATDKKIFYDGGVWRYHPTKHLFESVMEGTTNPWGMDYDQFGQIFISNSVTPHLYHVIFGGHVERRTASPYSRHAYGLLPPATDHLHWVGPSWDKSKGGAPQQLAVGGGHAHCGLLIYQGDSFPDSYRNTLFMVNVHGARINNDLPQRKGSGFTAHHGADFLTTTDNFFRGLHPKLAPDGSIYLSDWYDTGECHTLNPQRGNGRIYKISYKTPNSSKPPPDFSKLSSKDLVASQLDTNEWSARHARRLLQERRSDKDVHASLLEILNGQRNLVLRLRALWSLHVTDGPIDPALLDDENEYMRAWAIQLLMERGQLKPDKLLKMAEKDPSPLVRLYLASAAQRLDPADRWALAERLAMHDEDAADANLPLMYWYALEPLVPADPQRALTLAAKTKIPTLREFIARRVASK